MNLLKMSSRALVLGLVVAVGGSAFAAAPKAADTKKADAKSDDKMDAKTTHRVPAYYAKIGISDAQKQSIYKIQDTYSPEIKTLQDQLDALYAKRDGEIRGVLTPDQQKQLDAAVAAGKKAPDEAMDKKGEMKDDKKADTKADKTKAATPDPVKPGK